MLESVLFLKNLLSGIAGVQTCDVDLEPNISANDFPLIRIVAGRSQRGDRKITHSITIYAGVDIKKHSGGKAAYIALYGIENAIRATVPKINNGKLYNWEDTISDEATLGNFRVLAIRYSVVESAKQC